ncbi:DUF2330 domain-containing protein [Nocardia sp. NPDC058058]|uniref:DUF2330 domain-containing protein n=1 Tax=Nocardia sp. NPDC058058 TaxID=3346317 RepID=UPI0036DB3673
MLLRNAARLLAVVATVAGAGGMGLAAPASACACGGIATPGGVTARVNGETALLGWDGQRETIIMRLGLQSGGDKAALIVPTPAPATVSAGDAGTFSELARLTAPEYVTDRDWFKADSGRDGAVSASAPTGGAPTVLDRVQLGPVEATTLTGGDITGIQQWLGDNGYEMKPEVIATMRPYLDEHWSFVAMRLTSSVPLAGNLDPVRLNFAAAHPVYPMRMSSAATTHQLVHLYVLGPHRVQRTDPDAESQAVAVDFAGRISDPRDADLRQLSAAGHDYLTELSVNITDPARIAHDFTFADAPADRDYRQVIHRSEAVDFLGVPAGFALIAAAATAFVLFALLLRRVLRR